MTKHILSVTIHHDVDDAPDTSWIGEYTNEQSPHSIDRKARGDMKRGEYRYFTPANTAEETGNPDSPEQDYQRMEALSRGDWCMMGVWAEAKIQLTGDSPTQRIRSGGLWGIESDSGDYFNQIDKEQLADLRAELEEIGFTKAQIDTAYAEMSVKV